MSSTMSKSRGVAWAACTIALAAGSAFGQMDRPEAAAGDRAPLVAAQQGAAVLAELPDGGTVLLQVGGVVTRVGDDRGARLTLIGTYQTADDSEFPITVTLNAASIRAAAFGPCVQSAPVGQDGWAITRGKLDRVSLTTAVQADGEQGALLVEHRDLSTGVTSSAQVFGVHAPLARVLDVDERTLALGLSLAVLSSLGEPCTPLDPAPISQGENDPPTFNECLTAAIAACNPYGVKSFAYDWDDFSCQFTCQDPPNNGQP